jgi:phosphoribosylglycinamide formyltransferase-1
MIMKNIAIFASGSGSNAENIIRYFKNHPLVRIDSVWSNKNDAFVLERAKALDVDAAYFSKHEFSVSTVLLDELKERKIDLIVLAGFLLLMPSVYVKTFKIVNIHPALLPAYGGKGMYGNFVHQSVIANRELESGITIHLVDEEYDNGKILVQAKCQVLPDDTPESLAARIHKLEYEYFPKTIEHYLMNGL